MENMPKNYDAEAVEQRMLDKWLAGDYYRRNPGVGDCTVTIPPPNVTGKLHMGHALDDTIQDTIIRMNRMRGVSTRWILGTDHAGIATQTKVDKKLASEGISRREIGREKFVDACWDWTHEYGGHIVEQIKRMGCSIDFSDPHFTMDADYATAVRKVFCDWYHDGLIYRGKRIVNWCPHCTTAIADDEAEYKEEDGHLWYLRYPLVEPVDGQEYVVVATTRPETMLGDTGVAVSPKDHDKDKFVGAKVRLPIVDREIPIFSDFYVDAGFGTGFVKVTPAHDPNDYGMGERHGLEKVNIFDETAHVVEGYGEFSGMGRDECRQAVVAWFEEHGLLDHVAEGTGDRGGHLRQGHLPSLALDADVSHLDGEPQGLVHLAPAVVGPSHPRVPLRGLRLGRRAYGGHRRVPEVRQPPCRAGRGRARHLVLEPAVDVCHAGLARASRAPGRASSDDRARHRARHHRAVGGAHDHVVDVLS